MVVQYTAGKPDRPPWMTANARGACRSYHICQLSREKSSCKLNISQRLSRSLADLLPICTNMAAGAMVPQWSSTISARSSSRYAMPPNPPPSTRRHVLTATGHTANRHHTTPTMMSDRIRQASLVWIMASSTPVTSRCCVVASLALRQARARHHHTNS